MGKHIRRREFLRCVGGGLVASAAGPPALAAQSAARSRTGEAGSIKHLPRRRLGRIGIHVPPLSFGTAAMGHAFYRAEPFEEVVHAAIDAGITYIDTAPIYDVAEDRLKPILQKRRKDLFVSTKAWARTRDDALKSLEASLRRLGVDHVDVGQMHNVGQYTREEAIGKDGLLAGMLEARKRGWIKYIGCSGHYHPNRFPDVIDTGEIDLVMLAMNFVDRHTYNFEEKVLPTAQKHDCALVCMKVYGGVTGSWDGYKKRRPGRLGTDPQYRQMAVDYAMSLPGISTCVIGIKTLEELRLTIEAFCRQRPLDETARKTIWAKGAEMAREWGPHFGEIDG